MKTRKWILALTSIVAIGIIALTSLLLPGVKVQTTAGTLSIGIGKAQADELSNWTIKFNPTGTQIDADGWLYIRLDFYPPEGSKAYAQQYVNVPVIGDNKFPGKVDALGRAIDMKEYQEWLDTLPHVWQLNPALSHFIKVPQLVTVEAVEQYIAANFNADFTATLDDVITAVNSMHLVSPLMRDKTGLSASKISLPDKQLVIDDTNARLSTLSVSANATGTGSTIQPESIDMGSGAANYDSYTSNGYTYWDKNNPANATGTLDTFEIWLASAANAGKIGSGYLVSGTTYKTRASYNTGAVAAGSKQTQTGKSVAVTSGDFLVYYPDDGYPEYNTSGGVDIRYASGEYADANDQSTTDSDGAQKLACYATGTESGGTPSLANTPASVDLGALWMSRTYYAKGTAPSNPVATGDCTFTITNDGSITCNITASMTDMTGGTSWNLVSTSPSANEFRMTIYYVGQNPASGLVLTNTAQAFYNGLAASSTLKWDFKYETGTWTDTTGKTGTLRLTAVTP